MQLARWPFHLLVPAATITIAAGALLTFAAPKTVIGVRFYGGPTEHAGRHTVRLVCVRRETGVIDAVPLDEIDVSIDGETQRVRCEADGQVEVPVMLAGGRPVVVKAVRRGVTLAAGEVSVSTARVRKSAVTRSGQLRRASFQGATATGFVSGGALVLGRTTTVFVRMKPTDPRFAALACPPDAAGAPEAVPDAGGWSTEALGADVGPPRCGPFGWELAVSPTFMTAQLTLAAKAAPRELLWEGQLPVVSTPIVYEVHVDQMSSGRPVLRAMFRSARGAPTLHVRVDDRFGRRLAQVVTMAKAPDGQSVGTITWDLPPGVAEAADEAVLVVGSDDDVGASSWAEALPLPTQDWQRTRAVDPTRDLVLAPSVPWLDGLAPLANTEVARTSRARGAVGFFVLAGALLEVVLVLRRTRASTRAFQAHLAASTEEGGEVDLSNVEDKSKLASALVAVTLIAFGFAIIGLVVASRG